MPGIVGVITQRPREWAEPALRRMVEALRHESFYVTGMWVDAGMGVYVGWVARKGSFCSAMPLYNEKRDTVLAFSGEEYPEPGTARRLRDRGHSVEEDGSSYLVHLYEEDPSFPAGLNGRFHGVLIDRARGVAVLFNDRYGMHRVYYSESGEAFYFAAEAKAILAVCPELRRADARGLGELVSCGCVLGDRSVFEGVRVLPAGSAWTFRGGVSERKINYFRPREWEEQAPLASEPYYREVREVFSRNLPRYFKGPERVGMSLTGGFDTRMIMAWRKPPVGSLPCYTFGSAYRENRDVVIARKVARTCGQPHEVIQVGTELLSRFPHYAERTVYLTDACAGVISSPVLYVNERVREIAPVRMTGNYGDQILRRSRAFKPLSPKPGLFRPEFLAHVRAAGQTYADAVKTHPLSFAAFRQAPWHHYGLLALEQSQVTLRSPYLDNDFVRTSYRAPASACTNNDIRLRLIADGDTALVGIPTDRGFGGSLRTLPAGAVLREYHQLTFKAEYAYDYGMPQWVARVDRLLSPFHLERLFLGRHKYYHFRIWYQDPLSKYVREMLLDPRTLSRPYLERRGVEDVVRGHLEGGRNYTLEIHTLLTLELLHRLFLDSR